MSRSRTFALLIAASLASQASAYAQGNDEEIPVFEPGENQGETGAEPEPVPAPTPPVPAIVETETKPAKPAKATVGKSTITAEKLRAPSLLKVSGYIQPQFDFRYRPNAFPRDRTTYGAGATTTGLILSGEPLKGWSYNFHVVLAAGLIEKINQVDAIDLDGDGAPDSINTQSDTAAGLFIERAAIAYKPIDSLTITLGQMRIPFTIQNQNANFALMFPSRAGPNQFFLRGTDLGGLVSYSQKLFQVSGGIFNGTGSDDLIRSTRGLLYALRADVSPLGEFPFSEVRNHKRPVLGLGVGLLYFPSKQFEESGFEGISVRDLRASASVRFAVAGLYAQAEVLRRQRTDNLSSRPLVATGAYGQASYYIPVGSGRYGVAPIARAGVTVEDQSFEPRTSVLTEAGAAVIWHRGNSEEDAVKLIVQYFGEQRLTEEENAYGATTQLQLRF